VESKVKIHLKLAEDLIWKIKKILINQGFDFNILEKIRKIVYDLLH